MTSNKKNFSLMVAFAIAQLAAGLNSLGETSAAGQQIVRMQADPALDLANCLRELKSGADQDQPARERARKLVTKYVSANVVDKKFWANDPVLFEIASRISDIELQKSVIETWMKAVKRSVSPPSSSGILMLARILTTQKRAADIAVLLGVADSEVKDRTNSQNNLIPENSMTLLEAADYVELSYLENNEELKKDSLNAFEPFAKQNEQSVRQLLPQEILRLATIAEIQKDVSQVEKLRSLTATAYLNGNFITTVPAGNAEAKTSPSVRIRKPATRDPVLYAVLIQWVSESLSAATRNAAADDLKWRVTSPNSLIQLLNREQAAALIRVAGHLGAGPEAESLSGETAAAWVNATGCWPLLSHDDQASLIAPALGDEENRLAFDKRMINAETANTIRLCDYQVIAGLAAHMDHLSDAQVWASRAADRLLDKPGNPETLSTEDFQRVISLLRGLRVEITRDQTDRLLATASRLDTAPHVLEDKSIEYVSQICNMPKARARIDERFGTMSGKMDLTLVKVLAWLRRSEGTIYKFVHEVHAHIPDEKGDAYAEVKVAEAYAEGLTNKDSVRRTDGVEAYHDALTAARSDKVRLAALAEYVSACRAQREYQQPLQVIAGLRPVFTSDQTAYLDELTRQLNALQELKAKRSSTY